MNQKKVKLLRKTIGVHPRKKLIRRDTPLEVWSTKKDIFGNDIPFRAQYSEFTKVEDTREYKTFVSATKMKNIYQFGAGGHIDIVKRPQESHQVECVSGGRKLYKELKKRLTKHGYDGSELMEMPDDETINNFVTAAKAELEEEKL